jgi:hypothetical protein
VFVAATKLTPTCVTVSVWPVDGDRAGPRRARIGVEGERREAVAGAAPRRVDPRIGRGGRPGIRGYDEIAVGPSGANLEKRGRAQDRRTGLARGNAIAIEAGVPQPVLHRFLTGKRDTGSRRPTACRLLRLRASESELENCQLFHVAARQGIENKMRKN